MGTCFLLLQFLHLRFVIWKNTFSRSCNSGIWDWLRQIFSGFLQFQQYGMRLQNSSWEKRLYRYETSYDFVRTVALKANDNTCNIVCQVFKRDDFGGQEISSLIFICKCYQKCGLLKERICSLWEQMLSSTSSPLCKIIKTFPGQCYFPWGYMHPLK